MIDRQMSILVIDDFGSMRSQIRSILKQMGLENVIEARSGNDAKAVLTHNKIDFIISDWNMPDGDGLTLLRYVRGHDDYAQVPFLMVTGISEKKEVLAAVAMKVNSYIVKPFTAETMEMKIRGVFGCSEPLWKE